jgi:23S rRNA pseudouridine1911/1915/1917 synthase
MKSLEILRETEEFVAINKPAGMLSIPDREQSEVSLREILQKKYGQIFTVHRLDKDTSGVIVFAKNENSHKWLSRQFEERSTAKFYAGLVLGKVYADKGVIEEAITEHPTKKGMITTTKKGKPSITEYELESAYTHYSWMKFRILTGRTHQIRVHMKFLGHPIACDPLYGDGKPIFLSSLKKNFKLGKDVLEERPLLNRLALHSVRLVFTDERGETQDIIAPLPKDLRAVLQQIEKWAQ